jgi:hypothetical protein
MELDKPPFFVLLHSVLLYITRKNKDGDFVAEAEIDLMGDEKIFYEGEETRNVLDPKFLENEGEDPKKMTIQQKKRAIINLLED